MESATILSTAAHFGMPVSTTHSISTAIMGVGFAKSARSLHWVRLSSGEHVDVPLTEPGSLPEVFRERVESTFLVTQVIRPAPGHSITITARRNLMDAGYPPLFERMAALATVVKMSDEDLRHVYPGLAVEDALARVRSLAPDATLLYTRGARGMTAYRGGDRVEQPAFKVAVADTVGAGDACIGGYLASLLQDPHADLAVHVRFAAATAAAACTLSGAHAPPRAEVETLLPP